MNKFEIVVLLLAVSVFGAISARFPLQIIHINDFHAHFEPTCNRDYCDSGYARIVYTVKRLLQENSDYNPLYLNAGDNFQGTLWYNVGRWNVTSQFLNMLPADAMTLGNHEFDHGVAGVLPFLETIESPFVLANIDTSQEPTMQNKFTKSLLTERNGRKIGIIGIVLQGMGTIANTGNLIFSEEVEALKKEAQKLKAQGANIIIALTHCGYDIDKNIAKKAGSDVDIIVGSHSHTFLYTGTPPANFPFNSSFGNYPTVIKDASGHRTLIVQASSYARFVGNLRVYFDENGEVLDWEGAPIYMSADVPEDEEVKKAILPWKELLDVRGKVIIGHTLVTLDGTSCWDSECNLGNFVCDAMVHSFPDASIGFINPGGLRSSLPEGDFSFSNLITMSPFENDLVALDLTGEQLAAALEYAFATKSLLQVSGLRLIFDTKKTLGQQLVDVQVRCVKCRSCEYEPLDHKKVYRVVTISFLADGGSGFLMLKDGLNKKVGSKDIDALVQYTNAKSPINTGLEKRIIIL